MGALALETSGPQAALAVYHEALRTLQDVYSPLDRAHALEGLARCEVRLGERESALTYLREAEEICRQLGSAEAAGTTAWLAELEQEP